MVTIPKYLYHYTSIEAFKQIIKNHTIRFMPLDRVDDLQEVEAARIKRAGIYNYVSCWTEDKEESIPMWYMYAERGTGVRLRMIPQPFEQVNPVHMFESGFIIPQAISGCLLYQVEYTNESEKLCPEIVKMDEEKLAIELGSLGKYKNMAWRWQKEWRYMINVAPFNYSEIDQTTDQFRMMARRILNDSAEQACSFYDLRISNNAYKQIEVTTGPQITKEMFSEIIDTIIRFNPDVTIRDSELKGIIRVK